MTKKKTKTESSSPETPLIKTTIGDLIFEVYESALDEYGDEKIAQKLSTQMLLRKVRQEEKHRESAQKKKKKN